MYAKNVNQETGDTLMLFTDGSVDTKSGIGYGAYLIVDDAEVLPEAVKKQVQIRRFVNTSSTRLELETLLWALAHLPSKAKTVEIYTDSQNIIGLPARRKRLEKANFHSKSNRLITNHDLYREFYKITDLLDCTVIKARGHQPTFKKDTIDKLFTIVDKASRKALRKNLPNV